MKIPRIINNSYVKHFGLFALLAVPVVAAQLSHDKIVIKNAKTEIKAKDPQRYDRLITAEQNGKLSKYAWNKECKAMNDSMRIDSLTKKAYFEGAQMVRDSLKNTSKQ